MVFIEHKISQYVFGSNSERSLYMIDWLTANGATIVITLIIIVLALAAMRSMHRQKKKGGGCNGNCGSCGGCHH